jgi:uncharacterized protein (DUF4415 family)
MSDEIQKRRGRGKGKKPSLVHVTFRVPAEVLEFYKKFPSYTGKMRDVLTNYAMENTHV